SLERRDLGEFFHQLEIFSMIAGTLLLLNVLQAWLNQPCRAFGKVSGILVQTLVRIDADQAAGSEPQGPLALQPLVDEI
ncbi:hypothetical protein ACEQ6A_36065, partial [Rhizobium brockwellii]|uniref:hypothetical protein n=1 Tax=Rhizobium brockwellii TaxID=3019932 RepID=UPI003F960F10